MQKKSETFYKKISTQGLTVLIIGAIVQLEQRKRNKKKSSESGVENVDNTQEQSESAWLDFKISFERRYDLC